VREDEITDDLGIDRTYGTVKVCDGICVLPIDNEGYVYLAKQFRYGVKKYSIECSGGAIDEGETPLETAKRELKEELGIEADEWISMGVVHSLTSMVGHTENMFIARNFEPPTEAPYSDEEKIELVRILFEEAVEMVMKGEIFQSQAAVLILKAYYWLQNQK